MTQILKFSKLPEIQKCHENSNVQYWPKFKSGTKSKFSKFAEIQNSKVTKSLKIWGF